MESPFNKVAGPKAYEYCKVFKNNFFMEHLRWVFLHEVKNTYLKNIPLVSADSRVLKCPMW